MTLGAALVMIQDDLAPAAVGDTSTGQTDAVPTSGSAAPPPTIVHPEQPSPDTAGEG
jgi:hypothetical protein